MCWKNVDQQVEVIYSQNNVIAIFQQEPPETGLNRGNFIVTWKVH